MLVSDTPAAEAALPSGDAEAARYALLRRLAPSMRHHLVVNLQPIGMIYEVMERRLRAPQPDLSQVQESAHKINGFARAALNSCLDVVSWLAPDAAVTTTTQEGVRECASLLATSLSFRGYALRNEVAPAAGQIRRSAIRNLLTAALLYATDHHRPPAELVLSSRASDEALELLLATRPSQGDKGFSNEPPYRKLEWTDVQALARAEGVQAELDDEGVRIRLPWAEAA